MDQQPCDSYWDAVVIGTGVGGSTVGYALARAGWRVLFCEKGLGTLDSECAIKGSYPELHWADSPTGPESRRDLLRRAGRYFDDIEDLSGRGVRRFVPFVGAGAGGSSALYGMALERLFPVDFSPRKYHKTGQESSLPDDWPISYADLAPYYTAAESLYRVRGGGDPLHEDSHRGYVARTAPLAPANAALFEFFKSRGLHPYALPLACDFEPGCPNCQGYICDRGCKVDAARACLRPAVHEHQAVLFEQCEALRIEANSERVTAVVCRRQGRELRISPGIVVLAAGALGSPAILLRSANHEWPRGLANRSGLVGKNLMRHYIDLYAVFAKHPGNAANTKQLAFNDYYLAAGEKFGTFQSFGAMPPAAVILDAIHRRIDERFGGQVGKSVRRVDRIVGAVLHRILSRTLVFASIMEDLPFNDNEVSIGHDDSGSDVVRMRYSIRASEAQRIAEFRDILARALKPYRFIRFKEAENNERLAHACGTCRFGANAQKSVLDPNNRAHGLANLYVVDASFFPSSGGTNPALTIAANALRVADHIARGTRRR